MIKALLSSIVILQRQKYDEVKVVGNSKRFNEHRAQYDNDSRSVASFRRLLPSATMALHLAASVEAAGPA